MGQSSDAILVFGFDLGEDRLSEFLGEHDRIGEMIASRLGLDTDNYKVTCELEEDCPAQLITHCSDEYPMYILAIRGSVKRVSRGYPQQVSTDAMPEDTISKFELWCEEYNIPYQQPVWLLASYLG